jgi:hypothetical protein
MIVEIKMIFIGTTKITPKNRSELVFFGCVDRKRPVLGGPVRSPQYLGRSWTGCGPRLCVLGAKNRTEPDLKTLDRFVSWVGEGRDGMRGRTMTTTTIRHHTPLSSLVVCSRSRATSPTVRRCVSSLTYRPSLFVVVVARLEGTVDMPRHRHDVALDVLVCAVVDAAGACSVVGDIALCRGGGPSVLLWGGDADGGCW